MPLQTKAFEAGGSLREVMSGGSRSWAGLPSPEEVVEIKNPETYYGNAPQEVDEVVAFLRGKRSS
ncbi:MAG: hypothetical protein AB1503_06295 [Bacillota bacterium]